MNFHVKLLCGRLVGCYMTDELSSEDSSFRVLVKMEGLRERVILLGLFQTDTIGLGILMLWVWISLGGDPYDRGLRRRRGMGQSPPSLGDGHLWSLAVV